MLVSQSVVICPEEIRIRKDEMCVSKGKRMKRLWLGFGQCPARKGVLFICLDALDTTSQLRMEVQRHVQCNLYIYICTICTLAQGSSD